MLFNIYSIIILVFVFDIGKKCVYLMYNII